MEEYQKRYYLRYRIAFNAKLGKTVERWQLFDRDSRLAHLQRPQPLYEIELVPTDMDSQYYHLFKFQESTKDYEFVSKATHLETCLRSMLDKQEKQMFMDEVCDMCFN